MRRQGQSLGYGVEVDPSGRVVYEHDSYNCAHCGMPQAIEPGQTSAEACRRCDKHICDPCAAILAKTLRCRPTELMLEITEANGRRPIDEALARERARRSILG